MLDPMAEMNAAEEKKQKALREKERERNAHKKKQQEKFFNEQKNAKDTKYAQIMEKRKIYNLIHAIVLLPGFVMQFLQDTMIELETRSVPPLAEGMRMYNTAACGPLIWFIWKHYSFRLEELKLRKEAYHKTPLLRSPLVRAMFLEFFINIIHSPPFALWTFEMQVLGYPVQYSVDTFISVLSLGRLYILLRLFTNYARWTGLKSVRICQLNGFTPDVYFAVKCYMKERAMLILLMGFSLSTIIFGFAVMNFER